MGEQPHVNERGTIEGCKNIVHLVTYAPEQRRYPKGKNHVPEPVSCRGKRDSLGADLAGEDLGWVCPRDWPPGGSKGGYEEKRAGDDSRRGGPVVQHDPGDITVVNGAGFVSVGLAAVLLDRA